MLKQHIECEAHIAPQGISQISSGIYIADFIFDKIIILHLITKFNTKKRSVPLHPFRVPTKFKYDKKRSDPWLLSFTNNQGSLLLTLNIYHPLFTSLSSYQSIKFNCPLECTFLSFLQLQCSTFFCPFQLTISENQKTLFCLKVRILRAN